MTASRNDVVRCPWCQRVTLPIWVHGHMQCQHCHTNIDPCCGGEQAQAKPPPQAQGAQPFTAPVFSIAPRRRPTPAERAELKPMLTGPTALATVSGDEVALAKALQEAFRPYSRTVTIRGGLLGDRPVDADALVRLAALPGREILLGKFAGGIASPLTGFASVLAANLRNLAGVLNAVADQKQQTEGAA